MTALRLILAFPFLLASAAADSRPAAPILEIQTEAGFLCERADCGRGPDKTAGYLKLTECLSKARSKKCMEIPKEHRMTCGGDSSFMSYASAARESFLSCGEYLLDSVEFFWELLKSAMEFSAAIISDPKAREGTADYFASIKNYLAIEFFKAYREEEGTKTERLLKAAAVLAGDSFSAMFSWIKNFIKGQYSSFVCFSGAAQAAILCSVAVGLAIPLPGGSLFSTLSAGLRTGQISAKATKLLKKTVDDSIGSLKRKKTSPLSGKRLKAAASRAYQDISQRILSASKSMPKSVQNEIAGLFSKSNAKAAQLRLESALRAAARSKNITAASLTVSMAGALTSYRIFLSKQTSEFVAKEVSDQITTAYVKGLFQGEESPLAAPSDAP